MEQNEFFEFSYCAPEQEEIRRIRERYLPPQERKTKLDLLRELDAGVTRRGTMCSIALGTVSSLVMGLGMSLCMVWQRMAPGIVIGVIGMIGVAAAYPVYRRVTDREKKRITPQILKLTEELMQ